ADPACQQRTIASASDAPAGCKARTKLPPHGDWTPVTRASRQPILLELLPHTVVAARPSKRRRRLVLRASIARDALARRLQRTRSERLGGGYGRTLSDVRDRRAVRRPAVHAIARLARAEVADLRLQRRRLLLHGLAGRGSLFDERRVLLRRVVHLAHGVVHLLDAGGLLFARGRDLGDDVGHLLHAFHDFGQRAAGFVHQLRADLHLVDRVVDEVLDLLRGARAALREVAHLGGDHGEAAALLAGARRFHRGVQRQQVGLEGDLVDHADDVGDLAARSVDLTHGADRLVDHRAALLRLLARAHGELIGLPGVVCVLLHGGGHFLHARGGL